MASAPFRGAHAECRSLEVVYRPIPHVQMAVWVENESGKYIATLYVTRLTGTLGLANRPGLPTFKSDYRFPYGAREMVMPVWAHARGHVYGKVVMGGAQLQNGKRVGDTTTCGADCNNLTIGYHYAVSSTEPFYCGPSGGTGGAALDATSCASPFYGSKGAYLEAGSSFYPPRADLSTFQNDHDSVAATQYASVNDLGAVSGATPAGNAVIDPPVRWKPPGDGHYVLKVEVSKEFDYNAFHEHAPVADASVELRSYGLEDPGTTHFGQTGFKYGQGGFGQPSIVYATPFVVGPDTYVGTTATYAGYGDWDGATGTMHAPDLTITENVEGTGAGRLLLTTDQSGSWRVKVTAGQCTGTEPTDGGSTCTAPAAPNDLVLTAHDTSLDVSFAAGASGTATARYDVRYRDTMPIDESNFLSAIPPSTTPPLPGPAGQQANMTITGLRPQQTYYVAVRAISSCDAASAVVTSHAITAKQDFVTLHGCFIATAAYGTPLAKELTPLRKLRDQHLLTNPIGRAFVAGYYAMSPPLANAIAPYESLRRVARMLVEPLVKLSRGLEAIGR